MTQSIPSTMQAVQQDEPGGRLAVREIPVPRPQSGQVLVRMAAAPINPSDLGALFGASHRGEHTYPFTPGIEGSGRVLEAGGGLLPRWLNGRRVACSALMAGGGTWAEYMVTSAKLCAPLNKDVSLEQGAMLLVNPMSALSILEIAQRGKHRAIVNTAAASALGLMLSRLGKHHDIPVIQIVRRQAQAEWLRSLGSGLVINSSEVDSVDQLRTLAQKMQATLLLDAIGGTMTQQLVEAAPFGSTILLYSKLSTQNSVIDPRIAFAKDLNIQGWLLSNWLRKKNFLQKLRLSQRAQSLLATDLQSPIHRRIPLDAAQEGLETYISQMSAGKILLVASPQEVKLDR